MLKSIIAFALSNIIVLFMFSTGLAARPRELRQALQRPEFYGRALAVVLVAVPLVAYALVRLFRLPPAAVVGAIVLVRLLALIPYKAWSKRRGGAGRAERLPPGSVPT